MQNLNEEEITLKFSIDSILSELSLGQLENLKSAIDAEVNMRKTEIDRVLRFDEQINKLEKLTQKISDIINESKQESDDSDNEEDLYSDDEDTQSIDSDTEILLTQKGDFVVFFF